MLSIVVMVFQEVCDPNLNSLIGSEATFNIKKKDLKMLNEYVNV